MDFLEGERGQKENSGENSCKFWWWGFKFEKKYIPICLHCSLSFERNHLWKSNDQLTHLWMLVFLNVVFLGNMLD